MKMSPKRIVEIILMGVLMLSCAFAAESGNKKGTDRFSESKNFYDGKFHNHNDVKLASPSFWRATKAVMFEGTDKVPARPLPVNRLNRNHFQKDRFGNFSFVWLGNASVLINLEDKYLLTDPMFSKRSSFVQWLGPKRFHPVPVTMEDLPPLDAVIISHNHYDHLDEASIKKLDHKTKTYLVPLVVGKYLEDWGIDPQKIIELDWWQGVEHDEIQFIAAPALHFSGRGIFDQNESFWNSWVIKSEKHSVFFCGDSGMFPLFKNIGDKYGPFDLTIIPIGAYSKLWHDSHLFPEEAVQVHRELKGRIVLPIHWATFNLATHSWYDPAERFFETAHKENITAVFPKIGQVIQYHNLPETPPWWKVEIAPLSAKNSKE
jgi:L-ascorbate metabolism protein UlaG (beta-lactamase superfamily)